MEAQLAKRGDSAKRAQPKQAASMSTKVAIHKLLTGVRGLDDLLGGGIPEFSFNLIAGTPGCGKTTLVHQMAFANATVEKPALYFTVLGEPVLKMLRHQQQFTFFDESKIGNAVRFINLSDHMLEQDLKAVLAEIIAQVTAANAGVVVVDSFRTLARKATSDVG
jgi:circadian clock protein KaiC